MVTTLSQNPDPKGRMSVREKKGVFFMCKFRELLLAVYLLYITPTILFAGTYYVDDNGSASWADCEHNAGTPYEWHKNDSIFHYLYTYMFSHSN